MKQGRHLIGIGLVIAAATLIAVWLAVESRAQAPDKASFAGVWTLDHDLSDQPAARGDGNGGGSGRGRRGRGGYGGRGMGRGGFGGGMGRGGRAGGDPEDMARMREAMRDIMSPPDRLTIVQTDSMISITGDDGRSTRLSPDNKKIKDDNTKVERKTKWDAGKLVSEISGLGPAKMTQTFSVDPERHLRIVVELEGGRRNAARTTTHVYDPAEPR